MSCILRVSGNALDLEALFDGSEVAPATVWRKGERRSKSSVHQSSGANFLVSEAEFANLPRQIQDATVFTKLHREWLTHAVSIAGPGGVVMDFGRETKAPFWSTSTFPAELLAACGAAGVSLALSLYPSQDGENERAGDA